MYLPDFTVIVSNELINLVISCPDINSLVGQFLFSENENEIVLSQLGVPDLPVHRVSLVHVVITFESRLEQL